MGLASALSTSLTGLSASETVIDVVGNNMANANTIGFKESDATFATQFLQTLSLGSAATTDTGGSNPRQIGLGAIVASITPNFSQGTIENSSSDRDMAIQGDGFFIVQGAAGQELYTRCGIFELNSENQLVTTTGYRLLGYTSNANFELQTTTLQPLSIPLGSRAVAQATNEAILQGTLSPTGNISTQASIIQTGALTDSSYIGPSAGAAAAVASTPASATLTGVNTVGPSPTEYSYVVTYYNSGTTVETAFSNIISGAAVSTANVLGTPGISVTLNSLPAVPSGYDTMNIYRTYGNTPGTYYQVGSVTAAALATANYSYVDTLADPAIPPSTGGAAVAPVVTATTATNGLLSANETYLYRVVYYNSITQCEGAPSAAMTITLAEGQDHVDLSNIPVDASGIYDQVRIYRTLANETSTYYLVTTQTMGTVNYTDNTSDATLATRPAFDNSMLSATTYHYYFTYVDAAGLESTPQLLPTECLLNTDGRVELTDLPCASAGDHPAGGTWDSIRIYRNTTDHQSTYYLVKQIDTMTTGLDYTDSTSDAELELETRTLSFSGVPITYATLLTNVTRWNGTSYVQVFEPGVFAFTPTKGQRSLTTQNLPITATTTCQQLITFMEKSMGIQKTSPDPAHPIPPSNVETGGTASPGGTIINGAIRFVGNNGTANALAVSLSGMKLTPTGQVAAQTVDMPFNTVQNAIGESAVTDFVAYDSLGIPMSVRINCVLESTSSTATVYRWYADSSSNTSATDATIAVGTGLLYFDGEGNFVSATNTTVSVNRHGVASASPETFDLDFTAVSGLAADRSSLAVSRQDGSAAGTLTSFSIGEDGVITGVFSNGITRTLGQVLLSRFANPQGLEQKGESLFASGVNSGLPIVNSPGEGGMGKIVAGATELSNTDIGSGLIDLILASTMYRANSRVITTVQDMFDELMSLRR